MKKSCLSVRDDDVSILARVQTVLALNCCHLFILWGRGTYFAYCYLSYLWDKIATTSSISYLFHCAFSKAVSVKQLNFFCCHFESSLWRKAELIDRLFYRWIKDFLFCNNFLFWRCCLRISIDIERLHNNWLNVFPLNLINDLYF